MIFLWRRRPTTPRLTRAMAQSSSEIRQHAVQTARILGANVVRLPQVALPLGRLLGEDVATVGVPALVLAGSGLPEALGGRPIGLDLDLGHGRPFGVCSLLARAVAGATLSVLPLPACKPLNPKGFAAGP